MSISATFTSTTTLQPPRTNFSRSLRKPANTASTPDLNSLYSSQSRLLLRKTSLAALTPSSLASIPDVSESYAIDSVLSEATGSMPPATPGRASAEDLSVGDTVDVPGGMYGTVRFVGSVQGKKGTFVGVELNHEYATKGKNNGDVDGVSYFTTHVAGAGIFVPTGKVLRRDSPGLSIGSYPMTPTPNGAGGLRLGNQNSTNFTPPTPSLPKLSASLGPGFRAPSPYGKKPIRTSLPRPDSPVRRIMTPGPRPSMPTIPGAATKVPSRYGSPTNRFAQSVRGTAGHSGDPSKKGLEVERRPSIGSRSASALGPDPSFDEEPTPMGPPHTKTNGSVGSISSFTMKIRPASRTAAINEEEIERLRTQVEERDRQLKEQAATLAEMESSLTELQTLIEHPDGLRMRRNSLDDKDATQLRHMLREKNEKIALLTAEFDAHRADFRSTIDTLEMASTETERVYEKRIEDLMVDIRDLESRNLDVESVASQLKQLEELVQELEEGLEDARRGEVEARGEAEFLRGEVERTRSELRREREKTTSTPSVNGDHGSLSKELEQKEDEIRGLKAIIHSLSRDSVPDSEGRPSQRGSPLGGDAIENKLARDSLERQVAELKKVLETRNSREEELQQEIDSLRAGSLSAHRNSATRLSLRDSRDTVVPMRPHEPRSPEHSHKRAGTLDTMHESDTYSSATENSTLWCEICETSGHDILTCTNMFGPDGAKNGTDMKTGRDVVREGLKPLTPTGDDPHPAPLSSVRSKVLPGPPVPAVKIIPNPLESGPVAGKESGILDLEKWCAVCERDGHDSVDCPFEDAF